MVLEDGTALPVPHRGAGEVWCGVRPEDLTYVPQGIAVAERCLHGTALTVEPLGPDTLVAMQVPGGEIACRLPPRSVRHAGEAVTLAIDPQRIHLFDRSSGKRLTKGRTKHESADIPGWYGGSSIGEPRHRTDQQEAHVSVVEHRGSGWACSRNGSPNSKPNIQASKSNGSTRRARMFRRSTKRSLPRGRRRMWWICKAASASNMRRRVRCST